MAIYSITIADSFNLFNERSSLFESYSTNTHTHFKPMRVHFCQQNEYEMHKNEPICTSKRVQINTYTKATAKKETTMSQCSRTQ